MQVPAAESWSGRRPAEREDRATTPTRNCPNNGTATNSHDAEATSADVAARRMTTDSSRPNASQKRDVQDRESEPDEHADDLAELPARCPSRSIPKPAITRARPTSTSEMIARPAANLPLITSSRWIGWERSRGSVPSVPLAVDRVERERDAEERRDDAHEQVDPEDGDALGARGVNRYEEHGRLTARALRERPGSGSAAKYSGISAASPSTISRTYSRTLRRWSVNSLPAIVIQPGPEPGPRAIGAVSASARRSCRRLRSPGASGARVLTARR